MDEQRWAAGRRDDPDPGPKPDRDYVELLGGPLDGELLDVTATRAARSTSRAPT